MTDEKRLYNAHEVATILSDAFGDPCACNFNGNHEWLPEKCELLSACPRPVGVACWEQYLKHLGSKSCREDTADADEVSHGYKPGDVCFYSFDNENKSLALIEIVKILNDESGVAEIKFLKVFVDDTGNGLFDYLLKSGGTMNASFKYLKNITPIYGEGESNE